MVKAREDAAWFSTPAEWRAWLEQNHATETELWVGLRKKHVAEGIVYAEALDEALCHGWIDGIAHGVDDRGYAVRFTPRTSKSIWSAVNLRRIEELMAEGRVAEAGLAAWEKRDPARMGLYANEQDEIAFGADAEARFREHADAWDWFGTQPPGYRRRAIWWVMSAKRPETRERRLATLIGDSSSQRRVAAAR